MRSSSSPSVYDETSLRYPGWRVVVLAFFMALFGWGFGFYGHAVYLAELQRAHGWPTGLIAGASTLCYISGALLVAFVGDAMAWLGPRRFLLGGLGCMAAAVLLLPATSTPWQLYAVYLLMAAGWAGLGLGAITNLLGLWFHHRRGLAISLALNGASSGGIVISPLLVMLSAYAGFGTAMVATAAAMVLILLPLMLLWGHAPAAPAVKGTDIAAAPAEAPWTKAQALRSFRFWTISGPFALGLTTQVGFIVHQIAFLSPSLGHAGTGWAVALTTTMAVIGRVGLGTVIDRLDQRLASALSFASQGAALAVMALTDNPAALLCACAVFGFSVGNLITFPALIIQREFGAASFGMLVALSTAINQFTYAFGPGILGLVRDLTGGYAAALFLCVAWDLLAAAIVLIRPKVPVSAA